MKKKTRLHPNTAQQSLGQARGDVNQAKKLVASAIVSVARTSITSAECGSQRALRDALAALHTADTILEHEHDSAVARAQKAAP